MLNKILKLFNDRDQKYQGVKIGVSKLASYEDYVRHANARQKTDIADVAYERNLIPETPTEFTYRGHCYVCKDLVDFIVDFNYAYEIDGKLIPNWRERLVCPICQLNNRMRAVVHALDLECRPKSKKNPSIYITEQTTALYKLFKDSFSNVFGSEYLGDSVSYGSCNGDGIRNEDLTRLSFDSDALDFILSFDVLEHVPNYKKALAECYRCLKPDGTLFFTAPFSRNSEKNIVRAYLSQAGEVIHLLPPEYHGDPINSDGCLCFYHFGWEILDDLRTVGFKSSYALLFRSEHFGYLGGEQLIIVAKKSINHCFSSAAL